MTRPRVLVLTCLIGLALLGFFEFPGHTWLQQDTQIWVPMLERLWDPTALEKDLVASKPHLAFTLYDETAIALRWITRSSFHAVLIFEQIVLRILELLGIWLLARSFGLDRRTSILVAACFGLGATIIGPAVLTFEYEPVPRGFALGFLFLAIGLAMRRRLQLAGFATGCAILIHAPTALPVCILLVVIAIRQRKFAVLMPLAGAFVLLLIASHFQAAATESQLIFGKIDPEWERIERLRAPYNWVSTWATPIFWQYLFFGALTIVGLRRLTAQYQLVLTDAGGSGGAGLQSCGRRPRRPEPGVDARRSSGEPPHLLYLLPLIGLLSIPVSYVFNEKMKWALMPQLQPARAVLWVTALMIIVGATAAIRAAERRIWWESILWFAIVFIIPLEPRIIDLTLQHLLLALALAVIAWAAVHMNRAVALAAAILIPFFAIPMVGHVRNYPRLHTPEIEALAAYARSSTPKDATFLFPEAGRSLDPGLFRAEALRSVYVDWKAGGQVNYFRSLAEEWWTRWQATMSGKDIPANLDRFRSLGIDYVVMNSPIAGLAPVYSNARYLVYRQTIAVCGLPFRWHRPPGASRPVRAGFPAGASLTPASGRRPDAQLQATGPGPDCIRQSKALPTGREACATIITY